MSNSSEPTDSRATAAMHLALPAGLREALPLLWRQPDLPSAQQALAGSGIAADEPMEARARWQRFAPLLARLFPGDVAADGHIDSPLLTQQDDAGRTLFVKADHALPLTACIKARGGVYQVLCIAEDVARAEGLLSADDTPDRLAQADARHLLAQHRVLVGSTGNLGYSVGVIGRALGLQVEVHMSHDAAEWKKARLRDIGAQVVEHPGDYTRAVAAARAIAAGEVRAHFIDDEGSRLLFLGYAAAAWDLQAQLADAGVKPTRERPLRVYLPCGVGGAPGGVCFGLKQLFGDAVQCVFVEPVQSPCFLLRLATGDPRLTVYDIGLSNDTLADGMAVPHASDLVTRWVGPLVDAVATVRDEDLLRALRVQWQRHGLRLEPSAAAGFVAREMALTAWDDAAVDLVWTTGGNGLPDAVFQALLEDD